MPAHYPPPDHGGRHRCGLRFFVLRRPGAPAAPEPGPRAEGKASEPDTRSPARHAAPISRRTTEAAIYAASVFLTSAAPAPRQLQSRSPPPWSGTDTPAVPKPGLAPQGKHRSSARNIPAAHHPHHPEPAGKKHPLPATSSTSAPPGKAPPRTSLRPHAPARTREKLRSPPPHIRILAHLHLSPTPCSRAPPKLPLSPPRNARKNVTPHPAGRLPAPSRTSKCLPSPAGTKKAAAR